MKPARDPAYLTWVRGLPCLICRRCPVEPHHALTSAMSQKVSDYSVVPLCLFHHRLGPDAVHHIGRRPFAKRFGLDIPAIIQGLNDQWQSQTAHSVSSTNAQS